MSLEDEARTAKTASAPRRVTLHQLSFREHSEQNLTALGRFDRLCLRFLKFVVARRALAFCLVTGFYVALAGAGIAFGCLTPSPEYQYEWVIDDTRSTRNMDMRLAAVDAVDTLSTGDLHARKQPYQLLGTWVEYAGSSGHIFTPERLQEICEMEAAFYRPAEYQDVCVLNDDGQCAIPPHLLLDNSMASVARGACAQWDGNLPFVGDCRRRGNVDKYDICGKCDQGGLNMAFSWRKGQ